MSSEKKLRSEELTPDELALIATHKEFYASLADGSREPTTDAQLHFALAIRGLAAPETEHELAYLKYIRKHGLPGKRDRKDRPRSVSPEPPRHESAERSSRVADASPLDAPAEPRETDVPLAGFVDRCARLHQRFLELSAAGTERSSNCAERVCRIEARAKDRGCVAEPDLREIEYLEHKAESAESKLADQPKPDKSIEHEKWTGGKIKIGGGRRGWAEHEPGTPRPGWYTDDDYKKAHSNRASDLKGRNAPKD